MKKLIYILLASVTMLFTACEDDYDKLVKEPNDVTLNELQLEKFTHIIPDGGFKSGEITFNTKKNSDSVGYCCATRCCTSTEVYPTFSSPRYCGWVSS